MIESIYLDEEEFKQYTTINDDRKLQDFSKINIFIGSNNSGKSRFLRTFFYHGHIKYRASGIDIDRINKLLDDLKRELINFFEIVNTTNDTKYAFTSKFPELDFVNIFTNYGDIVKNRLEELSLFNGSLYPKSGDSEYSATQKLKAIGKKYLQKFEAIVGGKSYDFRLRNIYIPTLRSLRDITGDRKDVFLTCTLKDYFPKRQGDTHDSIYTGLNLYEETRRLLLGTKKDREKVKLFELFLQETFFNNEEVNLIPRFEKNVVYFRIGNHEEHPIYDLGDGIQSIIILTYPLFFRQGEKLNFFIEEPEHYLHPGFQRTFIETLLKFKDYQYFITTHSNHLLDLTLDKDHISIYTFRKGYSEASEPEFKIENVENEDSNILASIGVRNSSVFLSNCTIWVEGITDRIYIRKYLDIYQMNKEVKFKEDMHYSFVEYGGNNITHWSFLENTDEDHPNIQVERLCGKLFLISDKDGTGLEFKSTAKAIRQQKLREKLNDRYYCLESREIENILSPKIIKNTIKDSEGAASELDFEEKFDTNVQYQKEKLGSYIDKKVKGLRKSYADQSGTIKDKLSFAKKAVCHIKQESDLTKEALELTRMLYEFIKLQNI